MVILSMFGKRVFPCLYYDLFSTYSMAKPMKHLTHVSQHWCISLKEVHMSKLGTSPPKNHQFSSSFPFKKSRMFGGVLLLFLRLFRMKDFGMIFTEKSLSWDSFLIQLQWKKWIFVNPWLLENLNRIQPPAPKMQSWPWRRIGWSPYTSYIQTRLRLVRGNPGFQGWFCIQTL